MTNFSVTYLNASEINAVEALSNSLKKGASVQVVSYKETKMLKGNRANRNPMLGRVFERTTLGGWVVGTNYTNSCQNATQRSGSTETFAAKPSWHVYYNDFFEVDKASNSKYYLQLQKSSKTGTRSDKQYYVDGRIATDEEIETIKAWLPNSSTAQSSSQVEAGIDKENARQYICIALANIESIKQGSMTYTIKKEREEIATAK